MQLNSPSSPIDDAMLEASLADAAGAAQDAEPQDDVPPVEEDADPQDDVPPVDEAEPQDVVPPVKEEKTTKEQAKDEVEEVGTPTPSGEVTPPMNPTGQGMYPVGLTPSPLASTTPSPVPSPGELDRITMRRLRAEEEAALCREQEAALRSQAGSASTPPTTSTELTMVPYVAPLVQQQLHPTQLHPTLGGRRCGSTANATWHEPHTVGAICHRPTGPLRQQAPTTIVAAPTATGTPDDTTKTTSQRPMVQQVHTANAIGDSASRSQGSADATTTPSPEGNHSTRHWCIHHSTRHWSACHHQPFKDQGTTEHARGARCKGQSTGTNVRCKDQGKGTTTDDEATDRGKGTTTDNEATDRPSTAGANTTGDTTSKGRPCQGADQGPTSRGTSTKPMGADDRAHPTKHRPVLVMELAEGPSAEGPSAEGPSERTTAHWSASSRQWKGTMAAAPCAEALAAPGHDTGSQPQGIRSPTTRLATSPVHSPTATAGPWQCATHQVAIARVETHTLQPTQATCLAKAKVVSNHVAPASTVTDTRGTSRKPGTELVLRSEAPRR